MLPFALLLSFLCQDPPPAAVDRNALDVIALANGDELIGRITTELDGYIEIRLEAGAVVGLSLAQVAGVRRGAGPSASASASLPASNQWFVLHAADGAAVGWLSTAVVPQPDGALSIREEYEFQQGNKRYQITSLASADRDGRPLDCYFRERISEPVLVSLALPSPADGQQERIVEATCRGDRLAVQRLARDGRAEREMPWPNGASFPLLARTFARQPGAVAGERQLFDPAAEELIVCRYEPSKLRRVVLDGTAAQVTEVAETSSAGRNSEWVDGSFRTVRRELAGPALVAVPSNADSAKFAVGAVQIAGAIAAEAGGTFGLWVPNPAWQVESELPAGQVALVCPPHGAAVALTSLDYLEPGASVEAAADAVANWFRLLHPELQRNGREPATLRDRASIRLSADGRRGQVKWHAEVDVVPHRGGFLVLMCSAPAAAWEELATDFAFLRRCVEFEPQSLQPMQQGPLALRGKQSPPPVAPAPAPRSEIATAPAVTKQAPLVRIPRDG
jgi:hypothetical protein